MSENIKKETEEVEKDVPAKRRTRAKRSKPSIKTVLADERHFLEKTPRERELVTGVFINNDAKKQGISFSYCYNGRDFERYKMKDGETYTVPRYIAQHLNNCCYDDVETEFDGHGVKVGERPVRVKRYSFSNIDF